jgi:hypothetical protein
MLKHMAIDESQPSADAYNVHCYQGIMAALERSSRSHPSSTVHHTGYTSFTDTQQLAEFGFHIVSCTGGVSCRILVVRRVTYSNGAGSPVHYCTIKVLNATTTNSYSNLIFKRRMKEACGAFRLVPKPLRGLLVKRPVRSQAL